MGLEMMPFILVQEYCSFIMRARKKKFGKQGAIMKHNLDHVLVSGEGDLVTGGDLYATVFKWNITLLSLPPNAPSGHYSLQHKKIHPVFIKFSHVSTNEYNLFKTLFWSLNSKSWPVRTPRPC